VLLFSSQVLYCQSTTSTSAQLSLINPSATKLPEFDVASIKPNHSSTGQFRLAFTPDGVKIQNASLLMIIRAAYGMFNSLDDKFLGIPDWARTEKFDLEAKVSATDTPIFQKLNFDQRQLMVQALLADRFKLQASHQMREQPVYALLVAKGGPKLVPSKPTPDADPGGAIKRNKGHIEAQNIVISQLVSVLTQTADRTVLDKTNLTGKYDFTLEWTPEDAAPDTAANSDGPSLFTAIQEQLGLRLEPQKASVPVLVIDHLERSSAN
jgi:uncharacterized protein (TIGR03435 family)